MSVKRGNKKPLMNIYKDRELWGTVTYGSIPNGYGYRWTRLSKKNGRHTKEYVFLLKSDGTLKRRLNMSEKKN